MRIDIDHATVAVTQYPTFDKIQDGGGRCLENRQTNVSMPFLNQFAPN